MPERPCAKCGQPVIVEDVSEAQMDTLLGLPVVWTCGKCQAPDAAEMQRVFQGIEAGYQRFLCGTCGHSWDDPQHEEHAAECARNPRRN